MLLKKASGSIMLLEYNYSFQESFKINFVSITIKNALWLKVNAKKRLHLGECISLTMFPFSTEKFSIITVNFCTLFPPVWWKTGAVFQLTLVLSICLNTGGTVLRHNPLDTSAPFHTHTPWDLSDRSGIQWHFCSQLFTLIQTQSCRIQLWKTTPTHTYIYGHELLLAQVPFTVDGDLTNSQWNPQILSHLTTAVYLES